MIKKKACPYCGATRGSKYHYDECVYKGVIQALNKKDEIKLAV